MKSADDRRPRRRKFFDPRYVPQERRKGYRQSALLLVLSIPLFFFCERYVVSAGRVTDVSMLPALQEGNYFFINKFIYRFSAPERGDVVVLRAPEKKGWHYVKRVVGLPGETLQIRSGRVYVNGRPLEEPYAVGETHFSSGPVRIPAGSYYVLGDNRAESEDSRRFGSIPLESIEGKIKPGRLFSPR